MIDLSILSCMPTGTDRRQSLDRDALLALALAQPGEALRRAEHVVASGAGPVDEAVARQAIGIVLRDRGDTPGARTQLRLALRLQRRAGNADGVADVLSSLGITHALAGDFVAGIDCLTQARSLVRGATAGRVLVRLGYVLTLSGRFDEALAELTTAVTLLRPARDPVWQARAHNNRGLAALALGNTRLAEADFSFAEDCFDAAGQHLETAIARYNQGTVAAAAGQLPKALRLYDESGQQFAELGLFFSEVFTDECVLLLAAGLAQDALRTAETGLDRARSLRGQATSVATLALFAARAASAAGRPRDARDHARRARRMFAAQGRVVGADLARVAELEAALSLGPTRRTAPALASEVADRLSLLAPDESVRAHLLAARLALAARRPERALPHLRVAAGSRHRGSAIDRVTGWLAQAMLCDVEGRPRAMLAACARGLDVLDEYRISLGATEARATATTHGRDLVRLALRYAVARRDPRLVVRWNERLRSTLWLPPPATEREDRVLSAELAALRDVSRQLERQGDEETARRLRRRRDALEASVRARALRREGTPGRAGRAHTVAPDISADVVVVELVEVDGTLFAATVHGRRARLHEVGPAEAAATAVQHAQALLRRMARGTARHGDVLLAAAGRELQARLLGGATAEVERTSQDDAPDVVLVAPARLYAAPWTLLPALTGRVVALAPSTRLWARAAATQPPDAGHVVLVSGPGLATGGGEIRPLVAAHPDPAVLTGPDATAERVLAALDGAALAHVAAHGVFRSDNPQFSALQLADGPLTVFDLERLARPPHRMVLASCDSGRMAPAGADELLGMVTCLVSLGTTGVLAPISPVHDEATVRLMVDLHAGLAEGLGLPAAAFRARACSAGDPLAEATAASFLVFGA